MRLSILFHSFGYLTQAAGVTLALSLAGIALGFVFGTLACVARLSGRPWLERCGAAYVSVFRGVPLLVLLLFIYYFLATVGLDVPALVAAIGGLSLSSGAYQAEILRGALMVRRCGGEVAGGHDVARCEGRPVVAEGERRQPGVCCQAIRPGHPRTGQRGSRNRLDAASPSGARSGLSGSQPGRQRRRRSACPANNNLLGLAAQHEQSGRRGVACRLYLRAIVQSASAADRP